MKTKEKPHTSFSLPKKDNKNIGLKIPTPKLKHKKVRSGK